MAILAATGSFSTLNLADTNRSMIAEDRDTTSIIAILPSSRDLRNISKISKDRLNLRRLFRPAEAAVKMPCLTAVVVTHPMSVAVVAGSCTA
jgi:hypothetical protein